MPEDDKKAAPEEQLTGRELDDFKRGLEGNDDETWLTSRSKENLEGLKEHAVNEKRKEEEEEEKENEKDDEG